MTYSPKRIFIRLAIAVAIALFATFLWSASADKRGRWLKQAAWTNKTAQVKLLTWLETDVDFATGGGTALHGAAYTGNTELIRFLIEHGANVDYAAKWEVTPLWQARMNQQMDAEELLISLGANPVISHISPP